MGGGELGVGNGEEVAFETTLEDNKGLSVSELRWEGVPEPRSCPREGPVPKTAEAGLRGGQEEDLRN